MAGGLEGEELSEVSVLTEDASESNTNSANPSTVVAALVARREEFSEEDETNPSGPPPGRWQALKEDLRDKPYGDFLWAALFTLAAVWFMTYCLNFVHYRMPDPFLNAPLPDIIHDLVPAQKKTIASEVLYHAVTVVTVGSGLLRYRTKIFPYATRFCLTWAFSWYLRTIVLLATSLPPTEDPYCRSEYPDYPNDFPHPIPSFFWNTVIGFFTLGNDNVHCGDLLFSGHTTLITVDMMFMLTYMRHNMLLVTLTTSCTLIKAFLIVAERHHYTIDVLVSIYVSVTIWYMTPERLPDWLVWPFSLLKKVLCCGKKSSRSPAQAVSPAAQTGLPMDVV